jgi:hypothetical protein
LEETRLFVFNAIGPILFEKVLRLAMGNDEGGKGVRGGVRTGGRRSGEAKGSRGEEAAFAARASSG